MQKKETFFRRAVRQIVLVEGWHAVYWNEKHAAMPIHALGLGNSTVVERGTGRVIDNYGYSPEEVWKIFGLEYTLTDGWQMANDAGNFCGLLPPGETLESWQEHGHCANPHREMVSTPSTIVWWKPA